MFCGLLPFVSLLPNKESYVDLVLIVEVGYVVGLKS